MALQRTRRPRLRSGRSLRSLGTPLNVNKAGYACRYESLNAQDTALLVGVEREKNNAETKRFQ
jgi:hypothetical protein